ncbi:MAG TPA: response regulator transcription factor [Candidatus Dormibacteraeota bacterium]|jgi:DNA-binding NarL/FixJ family response regulator
MIRIALIDDHEMVREGLRAMLQAEDDFEIVAESRSADDLGDLVERTRPDIILLDVRLPGIGGAEACRRLTRRHPEVKTIMLTVYTDDDLVVEAIRAGARGYIVKDIERFDLSRSIRAVHRGEAVIATTVVGPMLERIRGRGAAATTARPALSEPQMRILRLMSEGLSNGEIAARLHLSENTVKTHVQEIFRRLGVRNRVEAAMLANREGLL